MAEDAGQALAAEMLLKDAALLQARDVEGCWRLLAAAAARCRQHRAWRREPFNLFSKLFDESDEVNLHSRFLRALLDHREMPDAPRANLEDFLIVAGCSDFDLNSATVERERGHIDILVSNTAGQAVAIENKIEAGDQPQQLWRYYERLKCERYSEIIMLYLTLDGRKPERQSIYSEDCKDRVPEDKLRPISYGTLCCWLKRCQERAHAEPRWREAIEQYLNLVRKLTGTGWREEYMKGLKELCIQGDNPRLIHDLAEALMGKKVDLLCDLLKDVENAVKRAIPGLELLPKGRLKESSRDQIAKYVGKESYVEIGLYWSLGEEGTGVYLGVQIADGVYVGIHCHKDERSDQYNSFKKMFENVRRQNVRWYPSEWGAWYKWVDSSIAPENFKQDKLRLLEWENIEFLCDGERRQEFATAIARELKPIWDKVHENTPA